MQPDPPEPKGADRGSPAQDEEARLGTILDWIESRTGSQVVGVERQGRWRPAWFVDVTNGRDTTSLYVRGARQVSNGMEVLEREFKVHSLLEAGGIKVAKVYGMVPGADAYVMDRVPGRHDLRHALNDGDRQAVRRQLAREMAKMHKLDIEPFLKAGLPCPETPLDTTLAYFHQAQAYHRPARLPDPRHTFLVEWVKRNAPPSRLGPRFTACDAGQFMYDGPLLTGMLDFEYAMLGDPLQDLAILRRRTTYEPMGDIPELFKMYEEELGEELDVEAVRYQTVINATAAVFGGKVVLESYLDRPTDDGDFVQYMNWVTNSTKQGYEGLAEVTGYPVPQVRLPDPIETLARPALYGARATAEGLDGSTSFRAYRQRVLLDDISYMERLAMYGQQFSGAYLEDASVLLQRRPAHVKEADELLEEYVLNADAGEDETLFKVLCADILRRALLLAIPGSTYYDGLTGSVQPLTRG
jgi:aminoglycoside phosphotransferase (APT) family kinase protein